MTRELADFAGDPRQWNLRRMTALAPSLEPAPDPTLLSPESFDVELTTVVRPRHWRFAAAPRAEQDPRHSRFSRFSPESVVLQNERQVDAALDAGAAAYAMLDAKLTDEVIRNTELPSWKKLTIQRGRVVYWFVGKQGSSPVAPGLPGRFLEILDMVVRRYREAVDRHGIVDEAFRPDPATTNSGWPTFTASPAAKLVGGLLLAKDGTFASSELLAKTFSVRAGLDPRASLSYGLAGRAGPSYKDRPLLRFRGSDSWEHIAEWKGYYQRNRIVQMSWFGGNYGLKPLYAVLQSARRRIRGIWNSKGSRDPLNRSFLRVYEADISGYDQSMTTAVQEAVRDALLRHFPELRVQIELWFGLEQQQLITPSWSLDDATCVLVRVLASIKSGLKLTSEFGTLVTLVVALFALDMQGIDVSGWPDDIDFLSYHSGDDVRLSVNRELDLELWKQAFAMVHLNCELLPGHGFLSRHVSELIFDAPIAGRIVQQSISNEHEPRGPYALGLVLLGFLARSTGAEKLPVVLQDAIMMVIRETAWFQKLGLSGTLTDVRQQMLRSDRVVATIKASLENSIAESWYQEQVGAADHSPTAALAVELADALAPELGERIKHRNAMLEEAMARSRALSDSARLKAAADGYFAITLGGADEGERWFLNSITRM